MLWRDALHVGGEVPHEVVGQQSGERVQIGERAPNDLDVEPRARH
jgi:hypothetical protein